MHLSVHRFHCCVDVNYHWRGFNTQVGWSMYPSMLCAHLQVLCLITFICSIVFPPYKGDGWVEFVALSALLTIGINFIFYLIGLRHRMPGYMYLIVSSALSLAGVLCRRVRRCEPAALGDRKGVDAACQFLRLHNHSYLLRPESREHRRALPGALDGGRE